MTGTDPSAHNVEIRRLRAGDKLAWGALWQENLTHFRAGEAAQCAVPALWRRLMHAESPILGWLILHEDAPAGLAHVVLRRHTFSEAHVAILEDLWISAPARRLGLARRFISHLAYVGRDFGWRRIEWETDVDNFSAQSLYDLVATPVPVKRYMIELV